MGNEQSVYKNQLSSFVDSLLGVNFSTSTFTELRSSMIGNHQKLRQNYDLAESCWREYLLTGHPKDEVQKEYISLVSAYSKYIHSFT